MNILILLFIFGYSEAQSYTFPDWFKFGVATASYQIEGAWNLSGKGENIWDKLTHERPELIADRSSGDIACDAYHKTEGDVQLLKDLHVDFYRFSISWSRILPTGYKDFINEDGVRYYNKLIDELLANGIKPMVTIYHWDLPQPIQEAGGWPNERIIQFFVDYAELLFDLYGDRVEQWITFNEPIQICYSGYSIAGKAPAYTSDGIACYLCGRTLLLAHAKVYDLYDKKYKKIYNGRVGISIDTSYFIPRNQSNELDVEASHQGMQIFFGWFANPIFLGDYPNIMKQRIQKISAEQGFTKTRLPEFTAEEIETIKGTADFLGINHYTSALCYYSEAEFYTTNPTVASDAGVLCTIDDDWGTSASTWLRVTPFGFRGLLQWIRDEYDNPPVIITENGYSDSYADGIEDCKRIEYYNSYLDELLNAIYEDGCKVLAYTAWSFMDNFEWFQGYKERFGLYHVDFEDDDRTRSRKMSSYVYENIIKTRTVDWNYTPEGFEECVWELGFD